MLNGASDSIWKPPMKYSKWQKPYFFMRNGASCISQSFFEHVTHEIKFFESSAICRYFFDLTWPIMRHNQPLIHSLKWWKKIAKNANFWWFFKILKNEWKKRFPCSSFNTSQKITKRALGLIFDSGESWMSIFFVSNNYSLIKANGGAIRKFSGAILW